MISIINQNRLRYFIIPLIFSIFNLLIIGENSQALSAKNPLIQNQLYEAEEYYFNGEFQKAIVLLDQILEESTLSKTEQVKAYIILTRIYVAKDDLNSAKDNIRKILEIEPNYQPTIEQETPVYVTLVSEVKKEESNKKSVPTHSGLKKWLLLGAGGAAVATVIVLVASCGNEKGNESNPLPEPPDFP